MMRFSRNSKPLLAVILLGTAPTACMQTASPVEMMLRPGVSFSQAQIDQARCEAEALGEVPRSNNSQTYVAVGGGLADNYAAGYLNGSNVVANRAEASLRGRLTQACMLEKGYRPVMIPACTDDETQKWRKIIKSTPNTRHSAPIGMGESACVANDPSGRPTIVNRSLL